MPAKDHQMTAPRGWLSGAWAAAAGGEDEQARRKQREPVVHDETPTNRRSRDSRLAAGPGKGRAYPGNCACTRHAGRVGIDPAVPWGAEVLCQIRGRVGTVACRGHAWSLRLRG